MSFRKKRKVGNAKFVKNIYRYLLSKVMEQYLVSVKHVIHKKCIDIKKNKSFVTIKNTV